MPSATLLRAIQRHRLESLLQSDPGVGNLLPDLRGDLQRAARSEAMAALALASLTREMAVLCAEAGIPLLVLKGIPLALQTTGSLTARGRGDCDLFVDPSQVGEAIALLQAAGFVLSKGASCVGDDSIRAGIAALCRSKSPYNGILAVGASILIFIGTRDMPLDCRNFKTLEAARIGLH